MRGTTLIRINQETLVAALQGYFDDHFSSSQKVVRVMFSEVAWVQSNSPIDFCVVELSRPPVLQEAPVEEIDA